MLRPWKTILELELDAPKAVFQQIADGITEEIQKGRLLPGTPLPGSRELAADIGVNRKTVVLAYEELLAEGWLSSVPKKGTFVSGKLPDPKRQDPAGPPPAVESSFSYNVFAETKPLIPVQARAPIVFGDGMPDVKLAPLDELARAYRRVFGQKARWKLMGYGNATGEERLRTALGQMLRYDRGMRTEAENLCVTRGSQMALYLTAHTLVKPGDTVAVENPGYDAAWQSFRHAGAHLEPVPVDEQGICTAALEKLCQRKPIKAVYVTPHHQYPTSVTLKACRRMHLVNLSNQYKFAIVEDDYDHDYHFGQRSPLPLASCGQAANVIYISTLSKLVAPAIRLGYVAGPKDFIESLANLRKLIDRQGDAVMEQAVAELLEEGEIRKHARRALNVYRERQAAMATYLHRYLGDEVTFRQPEGGLAFWVTFKNITDVKVLAEALLKKGVKIASCGAYSFHGKPMNAVRLGYAALTPQEMEAGIQIMAGVLATLHEPVRQAGAELVCEAGHHWPDGPLQLPKPATSMPSG